MGICTNSVLSIDERRWRRIACALLWSCSAMFAANQAAMFISKPWFPLEYALYAKQWSFRFEVFVACGFMWTNQLVWCFSNPNYSRQSEFFLPRVFPYPYVCGALLLFMDIFRSEYEYHLRALAALGAELGMFIGILLFVYPSFEMLFWFRDLPAGSSSSA